MCRPVTCKSCGKTTWAGCGEHVDQVRKSVPAARWCTCDRSKAAAQGGGWLSSLLSRSR